MNNKLILSNDLLDELSDEDLYLLIDIIPQNNLLKYIKINSKGFKNEIKGFRLDKKSKIMYRLPKIYFNRIKKRDLNVIKFIDSHIGFCIDEVNKRIFEVTSDKGFLEKAVSDRDVSTGNFSKLIDIILDILEPKYLELFFKLMNYKLSDDQNDYIDKQIKEIAIKKQLEAEITNKLEEEYKSKIKNIESQYKEELSNQTKKIKEIKEKLDTVKMELFNEKKNSNLLSAKIEQIEIEKNNEISILENRIKELDFIIKKNEEEKIELRSSIEDKELITENLKNQLSMRYDEYSLLAQEKWNLENERLLNMQQSLKEECERLKKEKELLNEDIRILEIEKNQLENKLSEYKDIVARFIENIDKKLIEKALYDSLLKYNPHNSINILNKGNAVNDLCIIENQVSTSIKECSNIYDFADNIAVNLENVGIKDKADLIANYIIGILATGIIPLICGYRAREIATAISASYSGETPYIISLPNGYTNSKKLLEIYHMAKANVVLIEDAVGTMNENALMPLLRERSQERYQSRLLLLSTENIDSVKYMPPNLFNQVALVMVDEFDIYRNRGYEFSNARKVFEEFVLSDDFQSQYKEAKKVIKKLINNLKLGSPYEMLRSSIVAYSKRLSNFEAAINGYLRSELMFICKCHNTLVELEENIQKNQLGENLEEIVRGVLGE